MFNCFNVRGSHLDSTIEKDRELLGHTKENLIPGQRCVWLVVGHARYDKRVNVCGELGNIQVGNELGTFSFELRQLIPDS
jgi:hypothetical protein